MEEGNRWKREFASLSYRQFILMLFLKLSGIWSLPNPVESILSIHIASNLLVKILHQDAGIIHIVNPSCLEKVKIHKTFQEGRSQNSQKLKASDLLAHKVSLAHNVSFWAQKLTHNVSFWGQKLCWPIITISGPRNCHILSVSGPRNCDYGSA